MRLLFQPAKLYALFVIAGFAVFVTGCIVPKNYPQNKPFVFATNINISGNLASDDKTDLRAKLENQLDDSMKVILKTIYPGNLRLNKPPVFDSGAAARSTIYMNNLLHAEGYYTSAVHWDTTVDQQGDQLRTTVRFTVVPGKVYRFDSITYHLQDSALQQLAMNQRNGALIKKGQPYSIENIGAEMDRMVEIFRNNGYYRFSRDDLMGEQDTVFAPLIDPSLDPFERIALLQEAKKRKENPTINLKIQLRNPDAVSHFRQYHIRRVSIYPDLGLLDDTTGATFDSTDVAGVKVYSKYNKFKPSFIASQNLLKPGELFRLRNSTRTYTNFAQHPIFTQVSIETKEAADSTPQIDVITRMYPGKKQDISITADASYNTGDIIATGNLFGVGLNLGLNNRNVGKQAIQSGTNLRTGVEIDLGKNFIQTFQTSLSHNISIPRLIAPKFLLRQIKTDSLRTQRTLINFNGAYTDRRSFYELKSLNASFGYQWARSRRQRKSHSWYYSPLNIEYVDLNKKDLLRKLIDSVPNLRYSFNTGLVISQVLGYNYIQTGSDGAKKNDLRIGIEESGGLFGLFKSLDQQANLYRYIKLDADYKHYINYRKSALVFRLYGGIGIPYGRDENGVREKQLPFFKAFYAGGPYSMRAWQVRQLGIGSASYFDTASAVKGFDRFGDIQLEGNIEYRFNLGQLFGVKVKSALFTDIGNIWYRNTDIDPKYNGADFNINKLYTDIAIGAGTSLRFDFDYFLIRFDWAYKIKDPAYYYLNYGWFHNIQLLKGQFQLGINYPF